MTDICHINRESNRVADVLSRLQLSAITSPVTTDWTNFALHLIRAVQLKWWETGHSTNTMKDHRSGKFFGALFSSELRKPVEAACKGLRR